MDLITIIDCRQNFVEVRSMQFQHFITQNFQGKKENNMKQLAALARQEESVNSKFYELEKNRMKSLQTIEQARTLELEEGKLNEALTSTLSLHRIVSGALSLMLVEMNNAFYSMQKARDDQTSSLKEEVAKLEQNILRERSTQDVLEQLLLKHEDSGSKV